MLQFLLDLEQTWFKVQSFLGGSIQEVRGLVCSMNLGSEGSKFKGFIPIPNGKFTHILIFYEVRTFGSVRGLVFFGRFGGSKFSFRGQT